MLSRTHQLIILFLSLCLTGLLVWRAAWIRSAVPVALPALSFHFIAVEGDVPQPGVRVFSTPPTVATVWQAAGGQNEILGGSQPLRSGSKIIVAPDRSVTIEAMPGPDLITLSVALDLNRACAVDLEAIPGLGPVLATRIVEFRDTQGPFLAIDDLLQVKGIGPKLLEKIRPYMIIIEETVPSASERQRNAETEGPN